MKKTLMLIALVLVAMRGAEAQRAIPMTLRTMVQKAGTIVHAEVTRTRTGNDPVTNMLATWITLQVKENFHGAAAATITFKQVGGEADGMVFRLAGIPQYTVGEEIILFLAPSHPKTGFSSPVGLGQGKFVVRAQPAPRKKVVEQIAPTNMLLKESSGTLVRGSLTLDRLSDEIRKLVRDEKGGVR